ncbi:MAG: shikimate dehydrogenase [Muribaculaceae bacterium]|nr:shikimate dehydrogenase [Muribaculaceae bacterium]
MLYGLIGRKLGHSFSARFFNDKFAAEGIAARYELFEIPHIGELPGLISWHRDLCGFNVTIPYKQDVMPLLAAVTDSARRIGAVNTVRVFRQLQPEGIAASIGYTLEGHNTDAPGFTMAIEPLLPHPMADGEHRALVLGTGGASRAVVYALRRLGISVTLVSRRRSAGTLAYEDLNAEVMERHNIVVNCTPLGMWPDVEECPPIPYEMLSDRWLCFDLVYNPETTEFMRRSAEHGATVSNGMQMLINQANLAWEFWQAPRRKRYMSRLVELRHPDGSVESHSLAIAELTYAPDGSVSHADVTPFSEEVPGVEYLDNPIRIDLPY